MSSASIRSGRVPSARETGLAGLAFSEAERLADEARRQRRGVVAVQGLGFVGAAVAAALAAARDERGEPRFLVLGVDLPREPGRARIEAIEAGESPVGSSDPRLSEAIARGRALENLRATSAPETYSLADVIVVDIHLDVVDRAADSAAVEVDLAAFEGAIREIGRRMREDALVVVETTVPIGACEHVIRPALERERLSRGFQEPVLLAHAYERVMPGPGYVDSVRRFWRSVSALDTRSLERARAFLSAFVDVEEFPLRELTSTAASEMAKLLENSYRAVNIAFMHEWTLLAEKTGVNLFEVVESIRVRRGTHDNIREPGFGVGGYCLTKDALLAQWAIRELFGSDHVLGMTLEGLRVNYAMPLHALALARELADGSLAGRRILLCGVAYLPGVADTRNSPAELFVAEAERAGAQVVVHDPVVERWTERPDVQQAKELAPALASADLIVFGVAHPTYRGLAPEMLASARPGAPPGIVDAVNVLDDDRARLLRERGARVAGVGKGHWRRLGWHEPA